MEGGREYRSTHVNLETGVHHLNRSEVAVCYLSYVQYGEWIPPLAVIEVTFPDTLRAQILAHPTAEAVVVMTVYKDGLIFGEYMRRPGSQAELPDWWVYARSLEDLPDAITVTAEQVMLIYSSAE